MLIRNDFAENCRPNWFSQILCSSITWNKHKESLFVNPEENKYGQDLLKSKSW